MFDIFFRKLIKLCFYCSSDRGSEQSRLLASPASPVAAHTTGASSYPNHLPRLPPPLPSISTPPRPCPTSPPPTRSLLPTTPHPLSHTSTLPSPSANIPPPPSLAPPDPGPPAFLPPQHPPPLSLSARHRRQVSDMCTPHARSHRHICRPNQSGNVCCDAINLKRVNEKATCS